MQSDRIKSWPADERPREKLLAHGAESLSPAELLAVVLRVGQGAFQKGVPGQNATAFAKQLLNQFGGNEGLDRAHVEDLCAVRGLGPAKVAQVKAAIRLGKLAAAGMYSFRSDQKRRDREWLLSKACECAITAH